MSNSSSALVWVDNYRGAFYPVDLTAEPAPIYSKYNKQSVKSLVNICCSYIVKDSTMTLEAIQVVPQGLCIPLMIEALFNNKDRAIEVLLAHWPMESFSLRLLAPNLFVSLLPLYNDAYLSDIVRRGMSYTTTLVHRFIQCLKNRHPTKLKYLDMTGYPTAEIVLYYLATHCLLAFNENRQQKLVEQYNDTVSYAASREDVDSDYPSLEAVESLLPDGCLVVKLDAFVTSESTFCELCKALKVSTFPGSKIRLCLQRLGATQLGAAAVNLILTQISGEHLTALQLRYNSLTCDDLVTLIPAIKKLKNLTSLDLACNNINFSSNFTPTQQISELLNCLPKLIRLDLSNNRVKCLLRRILCDMSQSLKYLRLAACGLRLNDLTYLSMSHHASGLQEVDLSSNGLSTATDILCSFFTAVKSSLMVLELEDCGLTNDQLQRFQTYISKMEKLMYLNLAQNTLSFQVLQDFTKYTASNPSVKCLRISYPQECYSDAEFSLDSLKVDTVNKLQEIINDVCKLHPRDKPLQLIFVELTDVEMEQTQYEM
ncbi:hypothetical protein SNE40_005332 [Patella caerulea]|uniref:Leucine-rich repeat-containing protein 14 n=1 Tax=Patella caerulea TaxID=87958 RepID=A0AAN8K2R2_PATCE